jgi:ribose transport system permease protein
MAHDLVEPGTLTARVRAHRPPRRRAAVQMRFVAIWLALLLLLLIGAVLLPRSIQPSAILAILPFAAFLAVAAMGQALVIMARGIDLSSPATVTLASTALLSFSGGADANIPRAIVGALAVAALVGLVNGLLVAVLRLNALIVTLAVGAIVSGLTLWYRQTLPAEARVPDGLATFGGVRWFGVNTSVWIAVAVMVALAFVLRKTVIGRNFEAVGANPRAAYASGLATMRYQCAAFVGAALLYGLVGIVLSAFIRNPTLEVGNPYLLAPIAAAVLGATSIGGGIGSMVAVFGAALFLTQLGQMLKLVGIETSFQLIIQGVAIAIGMWLSGFWEGRAKSRG